MIPPRFRPPFAASMPMRTCAPILQLGGRSRRKSSVRRHIAKDCRRCMIVSSHGLCPRSDKPEFLSAKDRSRDAACWKSSAMNALVRRDAPAPRMVLIGLTLLGLSACTSLGAAGPSRSKVEKSAAQGYANTDIKVFPLDERSAQRLAAAGRLRNFSEQFGEGVPSETNIGS